MFKIVKYSDLIETNIFKNSDLFSSLPWITVLEKEYNFKFFAVVSNSSKIFIPFAIVNNLKGEKIISLPFSDYVDTNNIKQKHYLTLVEHLKEQNKDLPIILKTSYDSKYLKYNMIRNAFYHNVDISSYNLIENNYSSSFRRGIRKAQKEGVTIEMDYSLPSLKTFYKIYSKLRIDKFQSIPQPFSFFRKIHTYFIKQGKGFILNAKYNRKTIASLIALFHCKKIYYKFGASINDYLTLRPNNLLFHELFSFGTNNGYSNVNLGLTGNNPSYLGLLRFKEEMGGVRHPITYYRIDPDNYDSTTEQKINEILKNLTSNLVNSKLNTEKINQFSKIIYKNFA